MAYGMSIDYLSKQAGLHMSCFGRLAVQNSPLTFGSRTFTPFKRSTKGGLVTRFQFQCLHGIQKLSLSHDKYFLICTSLINMDSSVKCVSTRQKRC